MKPFKYNFSLTLIILILGLTPVLGQKPSLTKIFKVENNGDQAAEISEIKVGAEYLPFKLIIPKSNDHLVKEMVLEGDYKYSKGNPGTADTIIFYSSPIKTADYFFFSEKNLFYSKDSSEFTLTNFYRAGNGKSGLKFREGFEEIKIMYVFPSTFKVLEIKTTPSIGVKASFEMMVAEISANDIKNLKYEIRCKRYHNQNDGIDKENKIIQSFKLEKKMYSLDLWDSQENDGDRINIYINGSLVLPDIEITNEKFTFPIPLMEAKKDRSIIIIESESDGDIGPNTIVGRLYGNGIDKEFQIFSSSEKNAQIEILVK